MPAKTISFLSFIFLLFLISHSGCRAKKEENQEEKIKNLIEVLSYRSYRFDYKAHDMLKKIGNAALPYFAEALYDTRPNVRSHSIRIIWEIKGKEALPILIAALKNPDKDIRTLAIYALNGWKPMSSEIVSAIKECIYDSNPEVICAALRGLPYLGETGFKDDDKLISALCKHLENPDLRWRQYAAQALGMVGNRKACPALVKALDYAKAGQVYHSEIKNAFIKIGTNDAVSLLLEMALNVDKDEDIRLSAASIFREVGDKSINPSMLSLINGSEKLPKHIAVVALGFQRNSFAVKRLMDIAADEIKDLIIRKDALLSLGKIGDPTGVDVIGKAIYEKDEKLRKTAAYALGNMKSQECIKYLADGVKDNSIQVVISSIDSLEKIGGKDAANAIYYAFNHKDAFNGMSCSYLRMNVAVIAHNALSSIRGENTQNRFMTIRDSENLIKIRKSWCDKLGLQYQEPSPAQMIAWADYRKIRLSIFIPFKGFYGLSCKEYLGKATIEKFHNFRIVKEQMYLFTRILSQEDIFHWQPMTAQSPFPSNHVYLLLYGITDSDSYQCSIGTGKEAAEILKKIIEPLKGQPKEEMDKLVNSLLDEKIHNK